MAKQAEKKQAQEVEQEFSEHLVGINRVAKVVKGGRRFAFAALMIVGDGKGRIGTGHGKAREVPEAIRKATEQAKRNLISVPLREGRTLHHDVEGRYGAGRVYLRSAPQGTGIIAGGPLRAIFESLGIQDVVAKAIGSNNPYNMVNATLDALQRIENPRQIAARRGKNVADIVAAREIEVVSDKGQKKEEPKVAAKAEPKKDAPKKASSKKEESKKDTSKKSAAKKDSAKKETKGKAKDSK